ncbi:type VII secretion protein EccB [Plantactinospora sp. GCM10030261]|uniref:type VII secretion protein EccB n=1 Tax=Plantactinospora sp. GCM10030261 TaxID=3273420 RepID=UPI003612FE16
MATRRDQLQSYQFMTQRVISAFVMRETDPAQSPLRRGIGAIFGGVMIAILVGAGFGVYGILTKVGTDKWRTEGSVVIEKETGASFVYIGDALHPTLNYASAMLAAGRPNPPVFRVAANSLGKAKRGITVGIPGAPDSLPSAKKRAGLPWSACAVPGGRGAGQPANDTLVAVSVAPEGGRVLGDEGLLVRDAKQERTYLLWHGRRHLLQQSNVVVTTLFGAATPAEAGSAWLNTVPAGLDIGTIPVPGRGETSKAVPTYKIGDVLVSTTGTGKQFYLVFDDGLAPITAVQQLILQADQNTKPIDVGVSETTDAPRSARLRPDNTAGQPPATPPTLVSPAGDEQLCAVTGDAAAPPQLVVGGTLPGADAATVTVGGGAGGTALADRVLVPAGRVAIVRVMTGPNAAAGPHYVITDLGIKYAVPSGDALQLLGYTPGQAVAVPTALVSRIPSGPALDPAAALLPALNATGR